MATAPLPSPQCGEHVEPGGEQPRRQIAASSSSSSSFSHIETLTQTPGRGPRATGGASPRAREPILLAAGASLPGGFAGVGYTMNVFPSTFLTDPPISWGANRLLVEFHSCSSTVL